MEPSETPSPEAIRDQLARIVASERFAGAPSLVRFLTHVVEETIEGRGAALKEYLIGVDVFDRGEAFDPRIDPIVRVQAGKLRKRLAEFYRNEGKADPLVIDFRKGSYVPIVRERAADQPAALESPVPADPASSPPPSRSGTLWYRVSVVAGLFILAIAVWSLAVRRQDRQAGPLRVALSRLTSDSGQTTHPAVPSDGRLLAFSSDRGPQGDSNIWVRPLDSGEALQLTHHPAADISPDFSPDGSRIVFRSWRDGGGIYVIPVLGGQERRIAAGGYAPRFSPDGKWVAYAQDGIQVVPASGGDPQRVSAGVTGTGCPLWTPDGKHLVFVGDTAEGYEWWVAPLARNRPPFPTGLAAELGKRALKGFDETACPSDWIGNELVFTLKVDGMGNLWSVPLSPATWKVGGLARQLVPGPGVDHARVLRSSGGSFRLVFATDSSMSHLWSLPVDANQGRPLGDIAQLTRDASLVGGQVGTRPILSADGSRLVFSSSRSGNLDIWMKDLATGKEESLTGDPRPEDQPVADGTANRIAYQMSDGGRQSIYLIEINNRLPRKLCDDCGYPMDMSQDGSRILYRGDEPWGLNLLDVQTTKTEHLWAEPDKVPLDASFSPDRKWIALVLRMKNRERQYGYVVPFDQGKLGDPKTWIPIAEEMYHLYLRWSPDGNLLYYFATRDDHRCLWAVHLDSGTKRPKGEPVAVRHFHAVQHYPLSGSWISVARDRLAFNLTDVTSNIWIATPR